MASNDRQLISEWAESLTGRVVDAGCGPGHWTQLLYESGVDVVGIDMVEEFVESAKERFPSTPFEVGDFASLPFEDMQLAASWLGTRLSISHQQRCLPFWMSSSGACSLAVRC